MNLSHLIESPAAKGLACFLIVWFAHTLIRFINACTSQLVPNDRRGKLCTPVGSTILKYGIRAVAYWSAAHLFMEAREGMHASSIPDWVPVLLWGPVIIVGLVANMLLNTDLWTPETSSMWMLCEWQRIAFVICGSGLYIFMREEPLMSLQLVDFWGLFILLMAATDLWIRNMSAGLYVSRLNYDIIEYDEPVRSM